jgi:hypothetical protein
MGFLAISRLPSRLDRTAIEYPAYQVNLTAPSPRQNRAIAIR